MRSPWERLTRAEGPGRGRVRGACEGSITRLNSWPSDPRPSWRGEAEPGHSPGAGRVAGAGRGALACSGRSAQAGGLAMRAGAAEECWGGCVRMPTSTLGEECCRRTRTDMRTITYMDRQGHTQARVPPLPPPPGIPSCLVSHRLAQNTRSHELALAHTRALSLSL